MTTIGGASLEVTANVDTAISAIIRLQQAAGNAFGEIRDALRDADRELQTSFQLPQAFKDFKVLSSTLSALDGQIRSLAASTKGIELDERFVDVLDKLQTIRSGVAGGLGDITGTLKEQEAVQRSLFELETQAAHEVAVARQQAFEQTKANLSEEQQIREALFLMETEGAHEAARAKEEAFRIAKKNLVEERDIQEALFLQQTQGAHDMAVAKEKAYLAAAKAAEDASRRERQAQEKLGAELAASINRINPQLGKDRQRDFDLLVAKASGVEAATGKVSGAFDKLSQRGGILGGVAGKLGGIFGKAEAALGRFGLSVSDASILLGAGFAGGIAGVIQVGTELVRKLVEMTKAVIEFARSAAFLASETESLRFNLSATFGAFSQSLDDFASRATVAFGIARKESLQFLNNFGQLFQSFGIGKESAAEMAEGLFSVAFALRRGREGLFTFEEALKRVRDAASGNLEALRELGLTLREEDLKEIAKGFEGLTTPFNSFEQSQLAIIAVAQEARRRLLEQADAPENLAESFNKFKAVMQLVIEQVGRVFVPVFAFAGDVAIGFAVAILSSVQALKNMAASAKDFLDEAPLLAKGLEVIAKVVLRMAPALEALAFILEKTRQRGKDAREEFDPFKDALEDIDKLLNSATRNLENYNRVLDITADDIHDLKEAYDKVNDAIADNEENVNDAEIAFRRAQEDAVTQARDAQIAVEDSYRERNKAIGDANEKLHDIEVQNNRALFDAERDLAQSRVDSQRRVLAAEKALTDARKQVARSLLDALLAVNQALRQGDAEAELRARVQLAEVQQSTQVKDAEKKLAEERIDARDDIFDAELKLQRAVEDATERIKDATRERAEAMDEAERRITAALLSQRDTEIQIQRQLFDAQDNLNDARRDGAEAVDEAIESMDRLLEKLGLEKQALADNLDLIEKTQNAYIGMIKRAEEFATKVAQGMIPFGPFIPGVPGGPTAQSVTPSIPPPVRSGDQPDPFRGTSARPISITNNINEVANDPEATAFAVSARLVRNLN